MSSSVASPSFLLEPSCTGSRDEYNLKITYICLSGTSMLAGLLVLCHMFYRGGKRNKSAPATLIGKLLRWLVIVQISIDTVFHTMDILFATGNSHCSCILLSCLLHANPSHHGSLTHIYIHIWKIVKPHHFSTYWRRTPPPSLPLGPWHGILSKR